MIKETQNYNDTTVFEGMTSISAIINAYERGTNSRKILNVYIDENKKRAKHKEIGYLKIKSSQLGFDISFVDSAEIDKIAVGNTHGGIIAVCTERSLPFLDIKDIKEDGIYYILEGIEDPYNFGNAIRSIYASGADGIIVNERNWFGVAGTVARASAGTSELINTYICESSKAIGLFKQRGYKIVCAGIRDSVSIFDADLSKPLLVVLGGEKRGISRTLLDTADCIVRIDYGTEFNGSLSTSASAAVFAFEILRKNKK